VVVPVADLHVHRAALSVALLFHVMMFVFARDPLSYVLAVFELCARVRAIGVVLMVIGLLVLSVVVLSGLKTAAAGRTARVPLRFERDGTILALLNVALNRTVLHQGFVVTVNGVTVRPFITRTADGPGGILDGAKLRVGIRPF